MVKESRTKQTEIGLIPEDWEYDFAGKYLDFLTGFPFKSDLFSNQGTKLLRGSNVKRNEVVWNEDLVRYWDNVDFSLNKYLLKDGDIIISMDGSLVGRSFGQIREFDLPCLLVQRVARLRGTKIHTNYLKQYYCSEYFTAHCDNNKTSSAIPHISPKDILEFKIPFPKSLPEQEAIAEALSDADAWIESLEQLIAKKHLIKQGAMQELLTAKEDWEVKKLGEVCEVLNGRAYSQNELLNRGKYKVLRVGNFFSSEKWYWSNLELGDKFYVDNGDLMYAWSASFGPKFWNGEKTIYHYHIWKLEVMKSVNKYFLYYLLIEDKESIVKQSQGGTMIHITKESMVNRKFVFPSLTEQIRIATILADMDAELEALEAQLDKARKIKQGMMQELLTGRVRLV
ncbi:restriction endonuclease subunit S [Chryseobacterium camelliae]|uniref:restriction endonuclease subunit S n=1 Tax=Chryseobacterium camelliae TaxID=1265445 RepID=UPI000C1C9EB6|nr:restriction endonuclease subunit S [Chryseobacterium camelliae]